MRKCSSNILSHAATRGVSINGGVRTVEGLMWSSHIANEASNMSDQVITDNEYIVSHKIYTVK